MSSNEIYNSGLPIMSADGTPFLGLRIRKFSVEDVVMSLGGKITGDVYYRNNNLSVTMQEYVEYKGVKYSLVSPPTIVKEGIVSDNSELNGCTKYSFVFYHPEYILGSIPFSDVATSSDNQQYLSQSKTFSWIGTLPDFVVKLNKNLQSTQWVVVLDIDENNQSQVDKANKMSDVLSFDKTFVSEALKTAYDTWEIPFVTDNLHEGEYFFIDEHGDSIDYYSAEGGSKRFIVHFGLPSNEIYSLDEHGEQTSTPFVFHYGQGVGLKNNSRTPKNNKIVTRIVGYGSDRNIPYGYPQIRWYGDPDWEYTEYSDIIETQTLSLLMFSSMMNNVINNETRADAKEQLRLYGQEVINYVQNDVTQPSTSEGVSGYVYSWSVDKRNNYVKCTYKDNVRNMSNYVSSQVISIIDVKDSTPAAGAYPLYMGILGGQYVKLIKHPFTRKELMPTQYVTDLFNKISPYVSGGGANTNYDKTIELKDYYDAVGGTYPNPINLSSPSTEIHQFEDIYPHMDESHIVSIAPYDERYEGAISQQAILTMIDSYIDTTRGAEKYALIKLYNCVAYGLNYLTDVTDSTNGGSYTSSYTVKALNSAYAEVTFTSDNVNIYQTVVYGDPSDAITWDDTMDDDGKYKQSYFKMTLPVLPFDLYACASITEEMSIYMRSGACLGCTFKVYVDWDDYKRNFFHNNLEFDPEPHTTSGDGHVRDMNKYPDTSTSQVTLILMKDNETFGTLMPNMFQYPKPNDEFVVLGISLPESYITTAQINLDSSMQQYMLENNVHYFEYPLKFDEYFLHKNIGILEQLRNNAIVRFKFGDEPDMALYVKQMNVKYGDAVLPQYDITLTDDIEIVLNQIGQVTDDVSRMRVAVSELQKFYNEDISAELNKRLSKVVDDVCAGRITFQQGLDAVGRVILYDEITSNEYVNGLYTGRGWRIDQLGNAEFESVKVRSFLEVVELLINRMQAQEGDTVFTDNDQIDMVEAVTDETDGSVSYILTLKEKCDGYVSGQMYGNVLKGIINTLAARQAGVSSYTDQQAVDVDGSNTYYTSWMRIVGTPATQVSLGRNQIRVVLYGDNDTPSGKNFVPCQLMNIARWGCVDYSDEYIGSEDYDAIVASIRRRQNSFYISASEGRIVKLTKVNKPKLETWNYGTTLGELPEFVKNYANVRDRIIGGRDYLYAQGVVVGDFIKIDVHGAPVSTVVYCGDWVDGSTIQNPSVGHGIYLKDEYNQTTQQYETHEVRHNGGRWQPLQHQPVSEQGVDHYYEPKFNSAYWTLVDGNDNMTIEFVSSNGYSFRRGAIDTTITPHLFYGNVDITNDVAASYWSWTRQSDSGKTEQDRSWDAQHSGVKTLHLTNDDMPDGWSSSDRAIFTCTVVVNDGRTTVVVDNQIIS